MTGLLALVLSIQLTIGPYAFVAGQEWISELGQWLILLSVYLPTWLACEYFPVIAEVVERMTDPFFNLNR